MQPKSMKDATVRLHFSSRAPRSRVTLIVTSYGFAGLCARMRETEMREMRSALSEVHVFYVRLLHVCMCVCVYRDV